MENFYYYKNNKFRDGGPVVFNEYRTLDEYGRIKNVRLLLALGREFMTRGDKDGYYNALLCYEIALCRRPDSFEAHLGEYKAWLWYCISISKDPACSILDDLYEILLKYTPPVYVDEVREMYEDDDLLAANTPEGRGRYEEK